MGKLIYLAGPLDGLDHDGTSWYEEFDQHRPWDVVGFMPGRAYLGASVDNASAVEKANRAVIEAAVGVVANLSGPGRALGTIREIEFARHLGKPVIAVGDFGGILAAWDLHKAQDLATAVEKLRS